MDIKNKTVLITGGASGMGKACVQYFQNKGAKVVIWDKDVRSLENNSLYTAISCDVSSEDDVERAIAETQNKAGIPSVCIQCAGIATGARMVGKEGPLPLSSFSRVIAINLIGTFNVMRVVADAMMHNDIDAESQERGVFINTASIAAFEGQIGQIAYSASKGGVVAMTLPAAREMAQFSIRVNTIAPGLIATPMLQGMSEAVQESLNATTLFPKRLGKPEEFAALAGHIIENPLINGEVIRLDGAIRLPPR